MSNECQTCQSKRVVYVSGKCSDLFYNDISERPNYVPTDFGIGGNDYMQFDYCLDCGQIQGHWPLPQTGHEIAKGMSSY